MIFTKQANAVGELHENSTTEDYSVVRLKGNLEVYRTAHSAYHGRLGKAFESDFDKSVKMIEQTNKLHDQT